MTDREAWDRYGCRACDRFREGKGCEAFPGLIPIEVASGQVTHFEPLDGDGGLQFRLAERLRDRPPRGQQPDG